MSESIQHFFFVLYTYTVKTSHPWNNSDFLLFQWQVVTFFTCIIQRTHSGESDFALSPPVHFSLFNSRVLFRSARKEIPSSLASKISCNFYLDSIVDRCVSFQCSVIFGVHDFASLDTVLNVTLFCALYLSTHRFDVFIFFDILSFQVNHS